MLLGVEGYCKRIAQGRMPIQFVPSLSELIAWDAHSGSVPWRKFQKLVVSLVSKQHGHIQLGTAGGAAQIAHRLPPIITLR
jgi:hypothetical protein